MGVSDRRATFAELRENGQSIAAISARCGSAGDSADCPRSWGGKSWGGVRFHTAPPLCAVIAASDCPFLRNCPIRTHRSGIPTVFGEFLSSISFRNGGAAGPADFPRIGEITDNRPTSRSPPFRTLIPDTVSPCSRNRPIVFRWAGIPPNAADVSLAAIRL